MKRIRRYALPLVVFATGASILVIEIVAVRILSPYYGSTIFTVSSVISVILAALSIGYYVGGRLADRYPSSKLFYGIITAGGGSVLVTQVLNVTALPVFGYTLSIISGPLISAIILFFVPAFLLGTLSPFAIKLQHKRFPDIGIGSIAGEIFFWSTLGSILGSLLAGFLLIPRFGISEIVTATGIFLLLLGFIPLARLITQKRKTVGLSIFFLIGISAVILLSFTPLQKNMIYSHDGVYERINIIEGQYNGQPARFLQQDRSISGAAYIHSDELVFDYTKYYSVYQLFSTDVKEILFIGGGSYSMPKTLLDELPNANVDVAEIEPSLFELAKKYFNLPDNPRLTNYTEDGRRLLHDTNKEYDLIFSDVYHSLFSIPAHFTTEEFFQIAHDKLSVDGVFYANIIGDLRRQGKSLIFSEIKTFQSVFPNSYFFAVDSPASIGRQNIIFVGHKGDTKLDLSNPAIVNHENSIIRSLRDKSINTARYELSEYPILTDNFAPIEDLTAKILRASAEEVGILNGNEMLAIIAQQLRYGPRYLSAEGNKRTEEFLIAEMQTLADETLVQKWNHISQDGTNSNLTNIIGRFYPEKEKRIILGTHYDSKRFADKDPENPKKPVPGANDSASGVAVAVEIARYLATTDDAPSVGVDIVFFDGEEGEEDLSKTPWRPLGSIYFADNIDEIYRNGRPISGVIVDMVCDKNLNITQDLNSIRDAPEQVELFLNQARLVDPNAFDASTKAAILNDHTSLNRVGIPSFLVIDFDYPYFHTTEDTIDKCSADSLETVAQSILNYIYAL